MKMNELFDTSGTVMYTFEFITQFSLSVAPTIQCLKKYLPQEV